MKNVFIIGSKGIPSNYGGFETFVDKLTEYNQENIKYHVSCLADNLDEFEYNNARCFNVSVPNIGPAKAVYYDVFALKNSIDYIEKNEIKDAVIYILACRIGPFVGRYKKRMKDLNIKLYLNPDGHEWLRAKWNYAIRKYWKYSERLMVKHADLVICDSKNIESYILESYNEFNPKTTYIAYGADVEKTKGKDVNDLFDKYCNEKNISKNGYYLIVGRFVPENNYETMIREFMCSKSNKDLIIISNVEENKFYKDLRERTKFDEDPRINFVGTVYNESLLKKIREEAYGYIHGHEVGGTNPSLLEALASTKLNLLLDVGFNREVGDSSCIYWSKDDKNLAELIDEVDLYTNEKIELLDKLSTERIFSNYSWEKISDEYSYIFLESENLEVI